MFSFVLRLRLEVRAKRLFSIFDKLFDSSHWETLHGKSHTFINAMDTCNTFSNANTTTVAHTVVSFAPIRTSFTCVKSAIQRRNCSRRTHTIRE